MNISPLIAYLKQPTTISGIGTLLGGAVAAVTQHLTHDPAAALTLFAAVAGSVKIMIPDNSAAQTDMVKFAQDAVQAVVTKHVTASLGIDAFRLVQDMTSAPTPASTTTATVTTTTQAAA